MNKRMNRWTTEDLERFHDGQLDEPQRSAIGEDLRRDPELRERYSTVRRIDELMHAALTKQTADQLDRARLLSPIAVQVLAAACLLVAVSTFWWFSRGGHSSAGHQMAHRSDADQVTEPAGKAYRPIRIVFSLPVRKAAPDSTGELDPLPESDADAEAVAAEMRENTMFLTRLDRAIAAQHVEETLDLLADASAGQRAVGYQYMGELLRSASVAEQILDRLSPQEQVQVCAHWAGEPVMQSLAFSRLRRFSTEPSLSKNVRVVLDKLARDPALHSWLRGYSLVDDDTQLGKTAPS